MLVSGKNAEIILLLFTLGGALVSALDPGASGPGSSPGWGHCVVFLGKTLNSLSASQVYKWVPANLMLGGNPTMD